MKSAARALHSALLDTRQRVTSQRKCSVNNDFLSKARRNDVESSPKGSKYVPLDQATDRVEPKFFANERYASTEHDSLRCEQSDGLRESERKRSRGVIENRQSIGVCHARGVCHIGSRDLVGLSAGMCEDSPIALPVLQLPASEFTGCRGDAPAGGNVFEFAQTKSIARGFRYQEMANLSGTLARPAIDLLVGDERAADSAANRHVQERRATPARAKAGFRHSGRVRIVFQNDRGNSQMLADPAGQWEFVPTLDLEGFLNATILNVDRSSKSDSGRLDLPPIKFRLGEQSGNGVFDLFKNARGSARRIDRKAIQGVQASLPLANSELQLGAANLDPQRPEFRHAINRS